MRPFLVNCLSTGAVFYLLTVTRIITLLFVVSRFHTELEKQPFYYCSAFLEYCSKPNPDVCRSVSGVAFIIHMQTYPSLFYQQ